MNRTVWKHLIKPGKNILELPFGSEVIHVGEVSGQIYAWSLVDPHDPLNMYHTLHVHGTGWEDIREDEHHIATVVMSGGLVWHIFEER